MVTVLKWHPHPREEISIILNLSAKRQFRTVTTKGARFGGRQEPGQKGPQLAVTVRIWPFCQIWTVTANYARFWGV